VTSAFPTILIVDDNARNRRLAADVLRHAGFDTLEAATAAEGIAAAARRQPQLILMDLRLPDLDGVQAVALLRAEPRTSHIPVVALSALPLDARWDWLFDAGFVGYVAKPIDIEAFPDAVRRFCGGVTD
jgi:two-component system, cell cycle response regulator DivK